MVTDIHGFEIRPGMFGTYFWAGSSLGYVPCKILEVVERTGKVKIKKMYKARPQWDCTAVVGPKKIVLHPTSVAAEGLI